MNNGLFGFLIGANVTMDVQEFDVSGASSVWNKPRNAKLCFIEGTGGGQAGGGDGTNTANRPGGCAGCAYQLIVNADSFKDQEIITIGAGGTGGIDNNGNPGGDTIIGNYTFAGGINLDQGARSVYYGGNTAGGWGRGGGTSNSAGAHGGFGAGGGGRGGGAAGGKPRSHEFLTASQAFGGGAASNNNSNPANDVDGFGEGAGGSSTTGAGNPGRNGRRGSGGGGGNASGSLGGNGGNGFLRVITYCWE